jgi:predicted nucleic acid-binding protein
MRVAVCDAGPIIHLYEAKCLSLLKQTGNIFIPNRVYMEVKSAVPIEGEWPEWIQVIKLSATEQNEAEIWRAAGGLHDGEAEAIVLARKKNADWFLTDDSATRLFVCLLGLEVHGSLGIILWSAAHRYISRKETEKALDRLEQSSLWLSSKIYNEARQSLYEIFSKDQ